MKFLFICAALFLAVLLLGCSPAPSDGDRLEVNDHLRAACYPVGMDDFGIETMINLAEADRLAGWEYATELTMANGTCSTDPDPWACTTCSTAIIAQVYGH